MGSAPVVIPVSSLDQPGLLPYRTLRRPEGHIAQGIFVAEGEKLVRRLLETGIPVVSLLLSPEWLDRLAQTPACLRRNLTVYIAETRLLREIVGYNIHQGIMAIGQVPAEILPENLPSPHLLMALDGLRSSENVGIIARNCAAFGADAIISGGTSCSPFLRRAVRNSMGAVFHIPGLHARALPATLTFLHQKFGTSIVASDPHGEATLDRIDFSGNVCIIMGNEDDGISREVMDIASVRVSIPMARNTDSLNVAAASAVFLFAANRFREKRR
jgi:tRNA G18 (ribose-2'-O)-methylase SpoU